MSSRRGWITVTITGESPATGGWAGLRFNKAEKIDVSHATIVGAEIGMTLSGCDDAVIASTVVAKCDTRLILPNRSRATFDDCLLTANREHGIRDNMCEILLRRCSVTENRGWGYFCEYYGSPTLQSSVVEGNKSGGIKGASYDAFAQARNSVFASNGGPCVEHNGTKDWDYSGCWWGESNTRRLQAAGNAANLRTITDQLDNPKIARVRIHGFLASRSQDAGTTFRWPLARNAPRL